MALILFLAVLTGCVCFPRVKRLDHGAMVGVRCGW